MRTDYRALTLDELAADIKTDDYRVHDYARQAYARITGKYLPNPGDRVTWYSERFNVTRTGTVDDVGLAGTTFTARIDADPEPGYPGRTTYSIDVDKLTLVGGTR